MNEQNAIAQESAVSQTVIETVVDVKENATQFITWIKQYLTFDNLFKLIGAVIILFAIYAIYKIVIRTIKNIPPEKLSSQKSLTLLKLIQYVYYFVVIMYVLGLFGVKLSAIWGAAGVAGVALAFAAQTSVSNIISGLFIVAEKTMKPGDLITVGTETGVVDSIGLLSVQIHTLDNQLIRIPNSTIINSNMVNTSFFPKRRICVGVSVAYDTDLEFALEKLKSVPALCEHVVEEPEPAVWFDKFGSSGIDMTLAVWFNSTDFIDTKNEVFINIKKVFDQSGIEIPFNKLDVKLVEEKSRAKSATTKKNSSAKTATVSSTSNKTATVRQTASVKSASDNRANFERATNGRNRK